jgi:hypothetical protein
MDQTKKLIAVVEPPKKIGAMSDQERLAFPRHIVGTAKAKMPKATNFEE